MVLRATISFEVVMHGIVDLMNEKSLTKTEQLIRDFLLDQGGNACFMTSTDIALAAGVSEATVIRFTRKLGFTGYTDFQKYLRESFQKECNRISQNITVPYERLLKSLEREDADYVEEFAISSQNNILNTISSNRQEKYDEAIKILLASKTTYILGSRANFGLASCTYFLMNCMLPGVQFASTPAASQIDNVLDISEHDVLLAFSFPRYSKIDEMTIGMAHEAGAKIIVICDRPSAPTATWASVVFTVDVSSPIFFNSFVGAQLVLETLCAGLSRKIGKSNTERLKNLDKYLDILKLY
jgi:DNA-binding MurR/RpiR family transcriptional regulator